jgi:hypothetical protein
MADHRIDAPSTGAPRHSSGCLRAFVILLVTLVIAAVVVVWKFEGLIRDGVDWFGMFSERMVSRNLTETFRQSVTEISSTNGDILEVAVMRTDETVSRHDAKSVFNDMLSLGTTVSEIRTPVVYRYHIKLSDPWRLEIEGNRVVVHAPAVRPSQPPAIETQGMQKRSEAGWLRFNAAENMAQLERDLTPTLQQRAGAKNNLDLVREPSRKSVAEFVRKWLLRQNDETRKGIDSLVVLFPDEISAEAMPLAVPEGTAAPQP